jgi:transketolase
MKINDFEKECQTLRRLIVETASHCGESAHIGGSLSMVELLNVLFGAFLNHNPKKPAWDGRDVFILSKGHAVLGYLATLHFYGYFDAEKLRTFQTNGSDLIAHPVKNIKLGIESSNGSLGQGLSFGLGMSLGFKRRGQGRLVYVLLGDGECNEGSVWETAASASELAADNLIAILDENGFRNDGANATYLQNISLADVWKSFGWNVISVDGHNYNEIHAAYRAAQRFKGKPSIIVAKTVKGKGIPFMEDNNDWHHNRITPSVLDDCIAALGQDI